MEEKKKKKKRGNTGFLNAFLISCRLYHTHLHISHFFYLFIRDLESKKSTCLPLRTPIIACIAQRRQVLPRDAQPYLPFLSISAA